MICRALLSLLVVVVLDTNHWVHSAPVDIKEEVGNVTGNGDCPVLTWESCCDLQRSINDTTNSSSSASSTPVTSGKYTLGHYGPFSATYGYCDLETDGGGWLVVFRRDSEINFNRNLTAYEDGFGDLESEKSFWYGLKSLHHITSRDVWELRVDLVRKTTGQKIHAVYTNFSVGEASSGYTLQLGPHLESRSTTGDNLREFNGKMFHTRDRDIENENGKCAAQIGGGWWFGENCGGVKGGVFTANQGNLRGWYDDSTGFVKTYDRTEMKIRQVSCNV